MLLLLWNSKYVSFVMLRSSLPIFDQEKNPSLELVVSEKKL
ncbi:hypothetical protein HanRHA438_Chr03g0119401 [Helianthus annuus]|nr:hypothetical protein HanRHA438_Chr03g0119401 [Helianthus annuus]